MIFDADGNVLPGRVGFRSQTEVRSEPCLSCPYRRDVPSGVWAHHEYEKLREYDAPTMGQPTSPFMCHTTPDHYCNDWAVCHSNRGTDDPRFPDAHPYDLFALRLRPTEIPESKTPLWSSGNEAADHGQRDIEIPSDEAQAAIERLGRKYPRLGVG